MFKEATEPSMFDGIQTVLFAGGDKIGKVFVVLNENLRLCLICDEVLTLPNMPRKSAIQAEKALIA